MYVCKSASFLPSKLLATLHIQTLYTWGMAIYCTYIFWSCYVGLCNNVKTIIQPIVTIITTSTFMYSIHKQRINETLHKVLLRITGYFHGYTYLISLYFCVLAKLASIQFLFHS